MLFKPHIKEWRIVQGVVFAESRDATFSNLLFVPKPAGLLDVIWYITAIYEPMGKRAMDEKAKRLYRMMKPMECELEVKGYLRKSMSFKPYRSLDEHNDVITDSEISDQLSRILNEDEGIMRLLGSVEPASMTVRLQSVPTDFQLISNSRSHASNITWTVTLSKILFRHRGIAKKVDGIIRLLNRICAVLGHEMEKLTESDKYGSAL